MWANLAKDEKMKYVSQMVPARNPEVQEEKIKLVIKYNIFQLINTNCMYGVYATLTGVLRSEISIK